MRNFLRSLFSNKNNENNNTYLTLEKMFNNILRECNCNILSEELDTKLFNDCNIIETESMKKYGFKIAYNIKEKYGKVYLKMNKQWHLLSDSRYYVYINLNLFTIKIPNSRNDVFILYNFNTNETYNISQQPIYKHGNSIIYDDKYHILNLQDKILLNIQKCEFESNNIIYVDENLHTHIYNINDNNEIFSYEKEYIEFKNNFITFDDGVYLFDYNDENKNIKILEIEKDSLDLNDIGNLYHNMFTINDIVYYRIYKICNYTYKGEYYTFHKLNENNKLIKMFKCSDYIKYNDIITYKDLDDDCLYKIYDFKHNTNIFSEMFDADENGIAEIEVYDNDKKSSHFTNQKDLKNHFINHHRNEFTYCFNLIPTEGADKIKIRFDKSEIFIPYTLDKIYINNIKDIKLYEHVK